MTPGCTKRRRKFKTCPKMTIFPSNEQFEASSVLVVARRPLRVSFITTNSNWDFRPHWGTDPVCCWHGSCLLVSMMTSQCHKPQADNGSPSVWLEPTNKTTNNNHFGGKSGVARAGSNWTGGILRHFIGFRYKQDPGIGWDGRVLGRPSRGKMSDIRGILLSSHKINWKLISRF